MSSDCEAGVNGVEVRRTGPDGSIQRIVVEGERRRTGHNSHTRVRLDFAYRVRKEDGRAALEHVERAEAGDPPPRFHSRQVAALLGVVERAVAAVPGVEHVERFQDTVTRQRPDEPHDSELERRGDEPDPEELVEEAD
jgi:hypothetical protein